MKRIKIALALVIVALVGVIVWQFLSGEREPVYKGKPLSAGVKPEWRLIKTQQNRVFLKKWAETGSANYPGASSFAQEFRVFAHRALTISGNPSKTETHTDPHRNWLLLNALRLI